MKTTHLFNKVNNNKKCNLEKMKHNINHLSFKSKIFILILFTSTITIVTTGKFIIDQTRSYLHQQVGQRALVQAKQISEIPSIIESVESKDINRLKEICSTLYKNSDATFITIGDADGKRLYHVDDDKIGKQMKGGDNWEAFNEGKSYISIKRGSLGFSLRGKSPIYNTHNKIIGIVSVGYTLSQLTIWFNVQKNTLLLSLAITFLLLAICAWLFSSHIKKQMLNMEPLEIANLFMQKEAIFDSVFEGIIAIDYEGRITAINQAAENIISLVQPLNSLLGEKIGEVILDDGNFFRNDNENKKDQIISFNSIEVIASKTCVNINHELYGWVISFRRKDDISLLNLALNQAQLHSENLRTMRHEQVNKMATLAGLLQMKQYDNALDMIMGESAHHQKTVDYINQTFKEYHLVGLLIGKYNDAEKLGIKVKFDPACDIDSLPPSLSHQEWICIIGNLLDNAIHAIMINKETLKFDNIEPTIEVYMSKNNSELVIEVADYGCGISDDIREKIFDRGVTTKESTEHGIGLYLVDKYIRKAKGNITIEENTPYGTIFSLFIPTD